MIRRFAWTLVLLACLAAPAVADDWPQWRGPTRDDVWRETGVVEKFAHDQLASLASTGGGRL